MERYFGDIMARRPMNEAPKIVAERFLKKVLDRMEANREATKLLIKVMPHIVNEAAMSAKPTPTNHRKFSLFTN